jgi:predicted metalloprotease
MRWRGGEQSQNLEDRRRMRGPTVAIGGGVLLLLLVVGMLLGVDPRQLNQLVNQAQQQANQGPPGQQRELTPEEIQQRIDDLFEIPYGRL